VIMLPDEYLARNKHRGADQGRDHRVERPLRSSRALLQPEDIRSLRERPSRDHRAGPPRMARPEVIAECDFQRLDRGDGRLCRPRSGRPRVVLLTECSMSDMSRCNIPISNSCGPANLCPHMETDQRCRRSGTSLEAMTPRGPPSTRPIAEGGSPHSRAHAGDGLRRCAVVLCLAMPLTPTLSPSLTLPPRAGEGRVGASGAREKAPPRPAGSGEREGARVRREGEGHVDDAVNNRARCARGIAGGSGPRRRTLRPTRSFPAEATVEAVIAARQPGVVAGLDAALPRLRTHRPGVCGSSNCAMMGARISRGRDGCPDQAGRRAGGCSAPSAPRLIFLCRMSGIATATRGLADAIAGYSAKIVCTRKTTPGLRALEKHGRPGWGGRRPTTGFGLDDAMLIKDNHIALAGGVRAALEASKAACPDISSRSSSRSTPLDQPRRGARGRCRCGAARQHGRPRPCAARSMMVDGPRGHPKPRAGSPPKLPPPSPPTGVDLISSGWITHSAPILDLGLDINPALTNPDQYGTKLR